MPLSPCEKCGGALRRSRRNFVERLFYTEAYRCEKCGARERTSYFDLKNAHYVKCPRCHSVDLTILKRRDGIDRMQTGFLNFFNRMAGGKLYHCWFCRLQFYDLRRRFNAGRVVDQSVVPPPEDPRNDLEVAS